MSPWLVPTQRLHRRVATGLVALACVLALSPPGASAQAAILLAGVTLVGMPHGAFDHIVAARTLRPIVGALWWLPFGASYLGLAGLVWLGWMLVPATTLGLFLALSVLHFGLSDTIEARPGVVAIVVRGGLPVLLPLVLHRSDVTPVLAALAGTNPDHVAAVLSPALWLLLPWGGALMVWLWRATPGARAEVVALCAAFVLLPPLLAFALYFCMCHSVQHLLCLGAMLAPRSRRDAFRHVLRVAAPAIITCAVGATMLSLGGASLAIAPLIRILAALTLPHMMVTAWLERDEGWRPSSVTTRGSRRASSPFFGGPYGRDDGPQTGGPQDDMA